MSPLSGVLAGILGLRMTAVLGGGIAATGMFLSSFVVENVSALYFTYGLMYGIGASLAYIPSLAILGHYFKIHLGKVNGVVTIGSSIFTVIMPEIMKYMIVKYGLAWLFRLLAVFTLGMAFCGLLFKPLLKIEKPLKKKGFKAFLTTVINVEIWKIRKYAIWALSMPIALFGYFVPYVLISKFSQANFPHSNDIILLQCIAVTSGLGRLIFGFLADRPGIDRIFLQQISFYAIGTLTIILPFMNVFGLVIAISLGMGLFDGAFISLIGPIAFQLCGGTYAAQAIGCMLGLAATPLSVGPPIAAYLFEIHKSYTLPFALAGISPLVGATLMFAVHYKRFSSNRNSSTANGVRAQPNGISIGK